MRLGIACAGLLLFAWGCSSKLYVQTIQRPDAPRLSAKPIGCEIPVHPTLFDRALATAHDHARETEHGGRIPVRVNHPLPPTCREIGDVFVGDTGWSIDCSWDRVIAVVRDEACRAGADAAEVITSYRSSFIECYDVRARLLACAATR